MKQKYLLIFTICIVTALAACKKDTQEPATLPGAWNIVTDSTFTGVGADNHPVGYSGRAGDYFFIGTDNKIYLSENMLPDTLKYTVITNNKLIIQSFGITLNGTPQTSTVTNLTAHTAVIATGTVATPGGQFGRKITLSR
jgi:hypothetical protein